MKTLRHITAGFLLLAALAACGSPAIKDYGAHSEQGGGDHGTEAATPAADGAAHASGPATQSAEHASSEPATPAVPAAATAPAVSAATLAATTQAAVPASAATAMATTAAATLSATAAATGAATQAAQADAPVTAVTGSVTYPQRVSLPVGAVLVVRIEDVTTTDKTKAVLAEQRTKLDGKAPPLNFSVAYDPAKVNSASRYAVSAMIQDGNGNVRFLNTTMQPVITQGARTDVGQVTLSASN